MSDTPITVIYHGMSMTVLYLFFITISGLMPLWQGSICPVVSTLG